jgi:ribosomal protein S10
MQHLQSRPLLDQRATIELTSADRQALEDLYRVHLAMVERLERVLGLPASRPTRAERRSETRER